MGPAALSGADRAELAALDGATLHGLDLSYFTGKLQAYLRYVEIPHTFAEMDTGALRRAARATGMAQMPALELRDGRWMTDSTAIIEWIDARRTGPAVVPREPALAYLSRLVEDYADEWLWRPALHYRWSYPADARLMSFRIATEMLRDVKAPLALRQWLILNRQRRKYLDGDGVSAETQAHIEGVYRRNLTWLQRIFEQGPYLLGAAPTLADFGYFASMFRHFGLDPTPARIMRDEAPAVFEWVARLWNAKTSQLADEHVGETAPADWDPILADVGAAYLPYLNANAAAFRSERSSFDLTLDGVTYRRLPVNRYRLWRLDRLQAGWEALDEIDRARVKERLGAVGAWEPLWREPHPRSGFDPVGRLPFLTPETAWAPDARPRLRRGRPVHDGTAR